MAIKAIRTSKNTYKFINIKETVNKVFIYIFAILATYGAFDLILRAHGL